ncbi:MAG: c-type cytochrome [Deltaproteobacteria bacterium]
MLRRFLKWTAIVLVVLVLGAWAGFQIWLGPSPADILADLQVPPAPVLSPEDELASFRVAPGFRVELVAAEPLVVDPVAMDWDDQGRLYVVEMRGFMPNLAGEGEELPVGRIVVLEDTDGDGRMDTSEVFLDSLVMPRAVAVLPEGVLVGTAGDLWLCRDPAGTGTCAERIRLGDYAIIGTNPEHQENGLLPALDGWIYNAKSSRRFRLDGTDLRVEPTIARGQWGLAQDDEGRLYYNHNSAFLFIDTIAGDYAMRQAATAVAVHKPGVMVALSKGAKVHGARVAPGLNRAYMRGTLRPDGRQAAPTGVSGLTIQRGHQFGPEFIGDAFVPEAAGYAVAHFALTDTGLTPKATHRLYHDDTGEEREFLVSTDERFRPVDAQIGPDGALWVIDMYRGLIQHAAMVSDYLHDYVEDHGLEAPGATGRIWRIVREDQPIEYAAPLLATREQQLAALDHPAGWARDRAQRRLAHHAVPETVAALRELSSFGALGRRHALWTLAALQSLDGETLRRALADSDTGVRRTALRAAEAFHAQPDSGHFELIEGALTDADAGVRLQALLSLGALPAAQRPLARMLDAGRRGDPATSEAARSGLAGREYEALAAEMARFPDGQARSEAERAWLVALVEAAHAAARAVQAPDAPTLALLDLVDALPHESDRLALLAGIASAQRLPRARRVELPAQHVLFAEDRQSRHQDSDEIRAGIRRIRSRFTWPGDPRPGGARRLTETEATRFLAGQELYADVCAACHGTSGRGIPDQAPALAGSPWVRDSDAWLLRIVLGGLSGPIEIDGQVWNLEMPSHGDTEVLDDERIAAILTFLRRSFGHAEEPIGPATVAAARAALTGRTRPWTVEDLLALKVRHRFDAYAGTFELPLVGQQVEIGRAGTKLRFGLANGPGGQMNELGDHRFGIEDLVTIEFDPPVEGRTDTATVEYEGMRLPLHRASPAAANP